MNDLSKVIPASRRLARRIAGKLRRTAKSALLRAGRNPRTADGTFQRSLALAKAGQFQASLDSARAGQAKWPHDPRLIRPQARAHLRMNQIDDALIALHRMEKAEPNPEEIDVLRRAIYRADVDRVTPAEGVERLQKMLQIWPENEEYRALEIRLLIQMGQDDKALERAYAFRDFGASEEDAIALVYDAKRQRMTQYRDAADWENATALWFELAHLSPERPRSANAGVDMALAAQEARRQNGIPGGHCAELDLMDALYATARTGNTAATRDALTQGLNAGEPLDWLPRYLKMFYRDMEEDTGIAALQTVGTALLLLTHDQVEGLFIANPPEMMDITAILSQHAVAGHDDDLGIKLTKLFLSIELPNDGRSRWEQIRETLFDNLSARALNRAVRTALDLARIEDFEASLACAREGQKHWPDEPRLVRPEARALLKLGQFDPAMEALGRLEEIDPNPEQNEVLRRAIYRLGITEAYRNGDLQGSLEAVRRALRIWPRAVEYRHDEIRMLVQLGQDAAGYDRVQAMLALRIQPRGDTIRVVHNAIRARQTWLGARDDHEVAISEWFKQARYYPDLPRSPNSFVDNCLTAQTARRAGGVPQKNRSAQLDLLDRVYDATTQGDADQTRKALVQILDSLQPHDWLARYLRLYHRDMAPQMATTAIQTLGYALLGLTGPQSKALFTAHPGEATSFITMFSRGQITASDPDMAMQLADMFLAALGPSTWAYSLRAKVNYQLENFSESHDDIARALALDPYAFTVLQTEFTLLATSGRHDDAAARLTEITASGKIDPNQLALLASKGQMTTQARALFQQAIRANPKDRTLVSAYLRFCYNNGYWGHCIAIFEGTPDLRAGHHVIAEDVYDLAQRAGLSPADLIAKPDAFHAGSTAFRLAADAPLPGTPAVVTTPAPAPGKRAAIVIGSLGPGGAERQCSVLVRTLARDPQAYGISQLKLFCTNLTQSPKSRFLLEDVRDVGIEPVEYFSRDRTADLTPDVLTHMLPRSRAQVMVQLREALQDFQPDVIHGILNETIINAGLAALHLGGTRLVGRWGSLPPGLNRQVSERADDNNRYLQSAYRDLIARHPNAHFYSNATEATRAYETWLGQPTGSFGTIYNGIEADQFHFDGAGRTAIRAELGIDPDAVVIGTAFRFTEEKRPFKWLDIARDVTAQSKSKMAFIMLGNGPLLLSAQRYAAEHGITNVHFVGRQSDIGRWWSAMDLGLMTSSVEGISNTVIEAQLLGRPVVAFDVGGMPEAINDGVTGKLFADGADGDMVAYLTALSETPEQLAKMSAAATRFALDQFSAEMLAKNTVALY